MFLTLLNGRCCEHVYDFVGIHVLGPWLWACQVGCGGVLKGSVGGGTY